MTPWRTSSTIWCFPILEYDRAPGVDYREKPGWRNFMTKELFAHVALRSGFMVGEQVVMDWDAPQTDCLSLVERL